MKAKTLILSAIMTFAMFATTSCSHDNSNDLVTTQSLAQCTNLCVVDGSDIPVLLDPLGFKLDFNYTQSTADIEITGLRLPSGASFPSLRLTNLKFNIKEGAKVISAHNVSSAASGYQSSVFDEIELYILDRMDEANNYKPVFYSLLKTEGYTILSTLNPEEHFGETTSTSADGVSFTNENSGYALFFHKDATSTGVAVCDIYLMDAQFAQGMPQLTMIFPNVPVKVDRANIYLNAEALTPQIGQQPYPSFPITNLDCRVQLNKQMTMKFNCGVKGVPYSVTAKCVNNPEI